MSNLSHLVEPEEHAPWFSVSLHYQDVLNFAPRILYDTNEDPNDNPTLILGEKFGPTVQVTLSEKQIRAVAALIVARFGADRRTVAALAATKDFTTEALEKIVSEGRTLRFALQTSLAEGGVQ